MRFLLIVVRGVLLVLKPSAWAFEKWQSFCEAAVLREEADYRLMAEQAKKDRRMLYLDPIKQRATY